jgi:hypothetical protein
LLQTCSTDFPFVQLSCEGWSKTRAFDLFTREDCFEEDANKRAVYSGVGGVKGAAPLSIGDRDFEMPSLWTVGEEVNIVDVEVWGLREVARKDDVDVGVDENKGTVDAVCDGVEELHESSDASRQGGSFFHVGGAGSNPPCAPSVATMNEVKLRGKPSTFIA